MATLSPRRINSTAAASQAPAASSPQAPATASETKASAPVSTPDVRSKPAASPAPASQAPATTGAGETEYQRKEADLIVQLRSTSFVESLKTVNPEIGGNASEAAIKYLEAVRTAPSTWLSLVSCSPDSVLASVRKLAAIGLTVSVDRGTAFLVPRPMKGGGLICTGVPGVRGQEETIMSQFPPGRLNIETNCAREQDYFTATEGTTVEVVHRRNFCPDFNKPNKIVAAYSIVRDNQTGAKQVAVVGIRQTDTVMDKGTPKEKVVSNYVTHDGRTIEPSRMGPEKACGYSAQRAVMRAVARTWLCGNKRVQDMIALEEANMAAIREESDGPSVTMLSGRNNGRSSKQPQILAPKSAAAGAAEESVEIAEAPTEGEGAESRSATIGA